MYCRQSDLVSCGCKSRSASIKHLTLHCHQDHINSLRPRFEMLCLLKSHPVLALPGEACMISNHKTGRKEKSDCLVPCVNSARPYQEQSTGPPGWGFGTGLTTRSYKTKMVTETTTRSQTTLMCNGPPESQQETCMNDNGKSQTLEATDRRMEVLSTKTKTRLGFWNVRTMYQTGKLAQVTSEMPRYNLHILGVSETRWIGSGKVITSTGETLLYSGREDSKHQEGVAIILKKGAEKSLIEWKPVNSRLIKIRMRGSHMNMTIIQCYSPTNDSEVEAKDSFYEQLDTEVKLTPRHDVLIIMGDLNAKVGKDNSNNERAMGEHGCGTMNENGERLIDFCNTNNLVVGGTLFPHRDIHKLTWYSPNDRDKNQIDHMMIKEMWRRSLIDVRVKRGADVGSDHQLVTQDRRKAPRAREQGSTEGERAPPQPNQESSPPAAPGEPNAGPHRRRTPTAPDEHPTTTQEFRASPRPNPRYEPGPPKS
uniref:Endonuclease/exonuclease/phosphatase domain-containing protein n=1 Tax=Oryzias latipes TaxID=8090 RepID=A0A3P9H430_ORYLA